MYAHERNIYNRNLTHERTHITSLHRQFADQRGTGKTYCPSEVARALAPKHWRDHMDAVREVADQLVANGELAVFQKGEQIQEKATEAKGPIRLGRIR